MLGKKCNSVKLHYAAIMKWWSGALVMWPLESFDYPSQIVGKSIGLSISLKALNAVGRF